MLTLSIELVPSTCWYSNVRSNVLPATWQRLQDICFEKAGHRCQICSGRGDKHPVELHEIWHYDDERSVQKLTGLHTLCPKCHRVKHFGLAIAQHNTAEALMWLATVNHMTVEQATAYVERAFQVHRVRSLFQWTLDVSTLTSYGIKLTGSGLEVGLEAVKR